MIHCDYYFASVGDFLLVLERCYINASASYAFNVLGYFLSDDVDSYKYYRDNFHPSSEYLNFPDTIHIGILDAFAKNT